MPMGLKNSLFTFQRAMQSVLQKHLWKHCMVYVDDIIIYSETIEEYMEHVCSVPETLANARFYTKISKCKFLPSRQKESKLTTKRLKLYLTFQFPRMLL